MMYNGAMRTGPRPLGLYFTALQQAATQQQMLQALQQFAPQLTSIPPDIDMTMFMQGLQRYQSYGWERTPHNYTLTHQLGRVQLYHCGGEGEAIVLIPSMVNKAYIFDLLPDNSLVAYLKAQGFSVYLIDWNDPEQKPDPLTLNSAITDRVIPMLEYLNQPAHVLGYCMGGLFALGAAQLQPELFKSLALLATPWDFSKTQTAQQLQLNPQLADFSLQQTPLVATDVLQTHFFLLDPFGGILRVQAMATETSDTHLKRLVALEDWLADGIPLERDVAVTLLNDFYRDNKPFNNQWRIGQTIIDPTTLNIPAFAVITQKDKLVPTACSLPLAGTLPNVTVHMVPSGHIGLMAGRNAVERFYKPYGEWVKAQV